MNELLEIAKQKIINLNNHIDMIGSVYDLSPEEDERMAGIKERVDEIQNLLDGAL